MNQRQTPFECAAKLAAGDHFLAGVAAFFEIDAAHRFVIEHLRYEGFKHGLVDQGHTAHHFGPLPNLGRQIGTSREVVARRGDPQSPGNWGVAQHCGIQRHRMRPILDTGLPGCSIARLSHGMLAKQAAQQPQAGGIAHFDFGPQHKHGQALERLGQ